MAHTASDIAAGRVFQRDSVLDALMAEARAMGRLLDGEPYPFDRRRGSGR